MSDESELLKKRFIELGKRAHGSGVFQFTDFLGLLEQSVFSSVQKELFGIKYEMFGGAAGAERVMVRFGDAEDLGYEMPFPITTLKISPVAPKFADKLTHRDYLGSIMNLGIERSVIGDIVIREGCAYVFVKEDIASYVLESLTRIKHTDVRLEVADFIPDGELYTTEMRRIQLSGERLDAVIAKVYNLSRDDASALFAKGLVFVSGRQIESRSYVPKEGDAISVRGFGRMIYRGFESNTRKGKLNVVVEVYV